MSAFASGAFIYTVGEIIFRGYTHWTMTLTGGLCLSVLYMWNELLPDGMYFSRWIIGALSITAIELAVGLVVNVIFRINVWDYSSLRFNFMGQISLLFSMIWCILSIPAYMLCNLLHNIFYTLK